MNRWIDRVEGFRTRETVFSGKNKKKFGKNKERPIDATSKASGRGDAPRAMTSKYTSLSVGAMFGEARAGGKRGEDAGVVRACGARANE